MTRLLESSVYNTRGSSDCISFALKLFSTIMRIVFSVSFSCSPANNLLTNRSICWNRCWLSGSVRAMGAAWREEGFATPEEQAVCLTRFVLVLSTDVLTIGAARWIHIHSTLCRHKSIHYSTPKIINYQYLLTSGFMRDTHNFFIHTFLLFSDLDDCFFFCLAGLFTASLLLLAGHERQRHIMSNHYTL